ncbi:unnamed protein product [Clonostachys chloroleuca]|uniref:Zn(2)-C6 fungal-type domain-containing protein n=1 Tax=Clonostachys chloroleuca TaxID=1926264 RepID=A0AA35MB23_9HYPO|nr:unnamed protein product [Clonostachys chloroleuca]
MNPNYPYHQAPQSQLSEFQYATPGPLPVPTQSTPPSRTSLRTPSETPSQVVKRRSTVACKRCRRLRSKCVHETNNPPCEACRDAGLSHECSFPLRGDKDVDRAFRRRPGPAASSPRNSGPVQGAAGGTGTSNFTRPIAPAAHMQVKRERQTTPVGPSIDVSLGLPTPGMDRDDVLPPPGEVLEGCNVFVTSYFQLGFIPKTIFLESLKQDPNSASPFLLACILSISARFTPSLVQRYGNPKNATDHFLEAAKAMVPSEMYQPSLARIQAFFLLAISQWGNGNHERSSMDMGIAVRMASILKLHREETYYVDQNSSTNQVIRSESARRVFWMIQSQENLHSGYNTPAPLPLETITTLLPCNEVDFAFGTIPVERSALSGTPPALIDPNLVYSPSRCLFATLIQVHGLWGSVARRARRSDQVMCRVPPWDNQSELQKLTLELYNWEVTLPVRHTFSMANLRGWKGESLHLAYLSVTMVLRLSNIVIRRIYLEDMLAELSPSNGSQRLEPESPTMGNANDSRRPRLGSSPFSEGGQPYIEPTYGGSPPGFWKGISEILFKDVWELHEQIDAYFKMRSPDEGFPQILVFCVYMCGSLSSHLMRYPALCPRIAANGLAERMAERSLEVLTELHAAWPTSSKWQKGLQHIATPVQNMSPCTDVETPQQHPFNTTPGSMNSDVNRTPVPPMLQTFAPDQFQQQGPGAGYQTSVQKPDGMLGELFNALPPDNQLSKLGKAPTNSLPNELLEMEINAFLQGGFYGGPSEGWLSGANFLGD